MPDDRTTHWQVILQVVQGINAPSFEYAPLIATDPCESVAVISSILQSPQTRDCQFANIIPDTRNYSTHCHTSFDIKDQLDTE